MALAVRLSTCARLCHGTGRQWVGPISFCALRNWVVEGIGGKEMIALVHCMEGNAIVALESTQLGVL
jgi:hypothetical protein